jgi:hypothetical protein
MKDLEEINFENSRTSIHFLLNPVMPNPLCISGFLKVYRRWILYLI